MEGVEALGAQDGEEGVSETGESDVTIPAFERAEFVIGEANFLFSHFKGLFNLPAGTGDLHQLVERRTRGAKQRYGVRLLGLVQERRIRRERLKPRASGSSRGSKSQSKMRSPLEPAPAERVTQV